MIKRVYIAVATTTLANLINDGLAHADVGVSTEITALTASGTPMPVPLGDGFEDILASATLRLRTGNLSTGLNTIFVDPNNIPATQDGDVLPLDSIIDVFLLLEFKDQDPVVDFDVDLPTLPGDPSTVVFDFTDPFFFDFFGDFTVDFSNPNLSSTAGVTDRNLFQPVPFDIGDINGDGIPDTATITGNFITTASSTVIRPDGRFETLVNASGTLSVSINPTFAFDLNGAFTIAEEIVVPANPVPVPAAVWLFGSGLLGLLRAAKRR